MDVSKDYYTILGILPSADPLLIKSAHKTMLKTFHPDKFQGTKEESHLKSTEINEAYRILSCKDSREEYDRLRAENSNANFDYTTDDSNNNFADQEKAHFHSDFVACQSSKERPLKSYTLLRSVNWVMAALAVFSLVRFFLGFKGDGSLSEFFVLAFTLIFLANYTGTAIALNQGINVVLGFPLIILPKSPAYVALVIINGVLGLVGLNMIYLALSRLEFYGSILGFIYLYLSFANIRALREKRKSSISHECL